MSFPDMSGKQTLEFGMEKVEVKFDENGQIQSVSIETAGLHPSVYITTCWRDTDLAILVNHTWLKDAYPAGQWQHIPKGTGSLKPKEERNG